MAASAYLPYILLYFNKSLVSPYLVGSLLRFSLTVSICNLTFKVLFEKISFHFCKILLRKVNLLFFSIQLEVANFWAFIELVVWSAVNSKILYLYGLLRKKETLTETDLLAFLKRLFVFLLKVSSFFVKISFFFLFEHFNFKVFFCRRCSF
jgi:hypothetical protein